MTPLSFFIFWRGWMNMTNVPSYFGCKVFDQRVMKARLPQDIYRSLRCTMEEGAPLELPVANVVASAMRDWAVEQGATHFTHWFQPMTGVTAEKHDSFISPAPDGGVIMEFSGKELIKGEPDASSFPSGGLRATFEARGYTAWDPTSYAFIKGKTLCIPTAFCSYGGEALDKKTPLLRSMEALNRQALRVLHLLGDTDVKSVRTSVGPEQEYFLLDRNLYDQRPDLIYTGRTLFGSRSPKGQELNDHYFGNIKERVAAYMDELNQELWQLGILAKTQHNEVAPAQHELAPIYTTTNIATDHNQLTMEIMQKVAAKHGLVCLLHEKPFAGVNGSGKHNNWSMATNTGVNLLSPGDKPHENTRFLLFLCAVIQAVDDYQDLLRLSVATAGNDHRLGAHEAPPAVVSIFLGDELSGILKSIQEGSQYTAPQAESVKLGVHALPPLPRDTTDRNRTSPFAFTGNKFEFRMLGSSNSIACANMMLNAAVAESLRQYADRLEQAQDRVAEIHQILRDVIGQHQRILFDGNGYDESWIQEAKARGLLNLPTTADCMPCLLHKKNVEMLTRHGVFSFPEIKSRCEIMLDNYCKTVEIEANTMIHMTRQDILPAVQSYAAHVAQGISAKRAVLSTLPCTHEEKLLEQLCTLTDQIAQNMETLEALESRVEQLDDVTQTSEAVRDQVLPAMEQLRQAVDQAETTTASEFWPYPSYGQLLFGVR